MSLLLYLLEFFLGGSADRTGPVIGKFLEWCARGDITIRVAQFRVVDIAAYAALVLAHAGLVSLGSAMYVGAVVGVVPRLIRW